MTQSDQEHWTAAANIARFEERLKDATDPYQRKMLEALILLEREKLKAMHAAHR